MVKCGKKNKKILKLLAATFAMSAILNGTQTAVVAQAAETSQTTTTAVAQTKDLTKFDLLETWTYFSNAAGNPDPILVNNGNGTYTLVMYQGTDVILNVNNPTYNPADIYSSCEVGIINFDDVCSIVSDSDDLNIGDGKDWMSVNENTQLSLQGMSCGSTVINVGLWNGDILSSNIGYLPEYNITIGVFVIPAQAGTQNPTYTLRQQSSIRDDEWNKLHQGEIGVGFGVY
jgi:hypothetical protein